MCLSRPHAPPISLDFAFTGRNTMLSLSLSLSLSPSLSLSLSPALRGLALPQSG